jgi:uncharacterized protein
MHPLIQKHSKEIAEICTRFQVRKLEVFGSAARGTDFDPQQSDADFLVEFAGRGTHGALEQYFGLRDALASAIGRDVDLVESNALRNPYVLQQIMREREIVFNA